MVGRSCGFAKRQDNPCCFEGSSLHLRGDSFVRKEAVMEFLHLHSRTSRHPLCIFLPFSPLARLSIFCFQCLFLINYSLHDSAWNQVLVTDQPVLLWSLSTMWHCPSAFNEGSLTQDREGHVGSASFLSFLHLSWIKEL